MRSWDVNMQRVKDIVKALSEEDPDRGPSRRRSKSTISTCSEKEHGGEGTSAAGKSETTKRPDDHPDDHDELSSDGLPAAEDVQEAYDMVMALSRILIYIISIELI